MIYCYLESNTKTKISLSKKMTIKDAILFVLKKDVEYVYLCDHHYIEVTTKSFEEAGVYYGETIRIIGNI